MLLDAYESAVQAPSLEANIDRLRWSVSELKAGVVVDAALQESLARLLQHPSRALKWGLLGHSKRSKRSKRY